MPGYWVEMVPGTGIRVIDMELEGRFQFAASASRSALRIVRWILPSDLERESHDRFHDESIIASK